MSFKSIKFNLFIQFLSGIVLLLLLGCTSDESYDNSNFVSEVNTALPDTVNSTTIPFVVVGNNGAIFTSSDGITWDNRSISGLTNSYEGVTYGNGLFMAVSSTNYIYKSTDAITWTKTGVDVSGNPGLEDIIFENSVFVAVGSQGTVLRSTNGTNWVDIDITGEENGLVGITYGSGLFLTASNRKTHYSTDGLIWFSADRAGDKYDIINANGYFYIAEGSDIAKSTNGSSWSNHSMTGVSGSFQSLVYAKELFIGVGSDSIWYTSDITSSWTKITDPLDSSYYYGITYRNNLFVTVGSTGSLSQYGAILTSSDGINWTHRATLTSTSRINAVY